MTPPLKTAGGGCGNPILYEHEGCKNWVWVEETCKSMWCAQCAAKRQVRIAKSVRREVMGWRSPTHVVLTMRNMPGLRYMVRKFERAWRRFGRSTWFRRLFPIGVWAVGLTVGQDEKWHYHMHIAAERSVRWVSPGELQARWSKAVGERAFTSVASRKAGVLAREISLGTKHDWASLRAGAEKSIAFRDIVEGALKGKRLWGAWGGASLKIERAAAFCPFCGERFKYRRWTRFCPPLDEWADWVPKERLLLKGFRYV